jgi:hypothetical protein
MEYVRVLFRLYVEMIDLYSCVVVSIRKDLWLTVKTRDDIFNLASDESELVRRWWRDPTKRDKVEIKPLWVLAWWVPPLYYSEHYPGEYDQLLWELEGKYSRLLSEEEKKKEEEVKREEEEAKPIPLAGLGALLLILLLLFILTGKEEEKT